jgi:hypothetical protein
MKDDAETGESAESPPKAGRGNVFQFPAVLVFGLYLIALSFVNIFGVVGGQVHPVYLLFSAIFFAVASGLLMMFRWAWSFALAAAVFLMGLFFWRFYTQHETPFIFQGLLNLVFFLYLVRPEVREKLR